MPLRTSWLGLRKPLPQGRKCSTDVRTRVSMRDVRVRVVGAPRSHACLATRNSSTSLRSSRVVQVFLEHTKWGKKIMARHAALRRHCWDVSLEAERVLKIAYVSPDLLSNHPVARQV